MPTPKKEKKNLYLNYMSISNLDYCVFMCLLDLWPCFHPSLIFAGKAKPESTSVSNFTKLAPG